MNELIKIVLYIGGALAAIYLLTTLSAGDDLTGNEIVILAIFLVVILPVVVMLGVAKKERGQQTNDSKS